MPPFRSRLAAEPTTAIPLDSFNRTDFGNSVTRPVRYLRLKHPVVRPHHRAMERLVLMGKRTDSRSQMPHDAGYSARRLARCLDLASDRASVCLTGCTVASARAESSNQLASALANS